VARWLEDVQNYANEKIVLSLIGNKCDMEGRFNPELIIYTDRFKTG